MSKMPQTLDLFPQHIPPPPSLPYARALCRVLPGGIFQGRALCGRGWGRAGEERGGWGRAGGHGCPLSAAAEGAPCPMRGRFAGFLPGEFFREGRFAGRGWGRAGEERGARGGRRAWLPAARCGGGCPLSYARALCRVPPRGNFSGKGALPGGRRKGGLGEGRRAWLPAAAEGAPCPMRGRFAGFLPGGTFQGRALCRAEMGQGGRAGGMFDS